MSISVLQLVCYTIPTFCNHLNTIANIRKISLLDNRLQWLNKVMSARCGQYLEYIHDLDPSIGQHQQKAFLDHFRI